MQYAEYNLWANEAMIDLILSLPEEKIHQEISSSFNNLYSTILHMWNAESVWFQRIKLAEQIHWPAQEFSGDVYELGKKWKEQSKQWITWIGSATDAALSHEFSYQDSKKNRYKQPVADVIMHVFNHNTYHRGQLVNMLRQLEIEKIPSTDLIIYLRKK